MSFLKLAPELVDNVADYLKDSEVRQLSKTCQQFRQYLAPRVFRKIVFTQDVEVADSALSAVLAWGPYVKELRFEEDCLAKCGSIKHTYLDETDFDNREDAAIAIPNPAKIFSPSALVLLKTEKALLPNLRELEITFKTYNSNSLCDLYYNSFFYGLPFVLDKSMNLRDFKRAVSRQSYLENTYAALVSNEAISHLRIQRFYPIQCTVFRTQQWRSFLERLETLEISIYDQRDSSDRFSVTHEQYKCGLRRMDAWLFDYLSNAKSLKLEASVHGPIGLICDGQEGEIPHNPLPFKPHSMPALEELEIHNIFVGKDLLAFLKQHGRIHTIALKNAFAASTRDWFGESGKISWKEIFDELRGLDLKLRKFTLDTSTCFSAEDYWGSPLAEGNRDGEEVKSEVKRIRAVLKEDPQRKPFCYAFHLVGHVKVIWQHYEDNRRSFYLGEDQASYDEFMRTVNSK